MPLLYNEKKMTRKINSSIFATAVLSVAVVLLQQTAFADELIFTDLPIGLKIGETGNIDAGFTMTLLEVEDSRCPSDVVCVWQGTVNAKVQLNKEGKDLGLFTIPMESIEGGDQIFEGYYIRLTNVEPYPVSTNPIEDEDYTLAFFVSKALDDSFDSPLKQFKRGVPFSEIECRDNLRLTQRYDGSPACVKPQTYDELIKRDWVSDIIRAVQSTDHSGSNGTIKPVINTGTSAGFCFGYCTKDFVITPEKITYTQSGRDVPDIVKEIPFSKSAWSKIVDSIDFEKFNALPEYIGCPGCADAPVEYIVITKGDISKKVNFEIVVDAPEIKGLIMALHEVRGPIEANIESFEECAAAGNPVMESYPRQCRTEDGKHFVEEVDVLDTKAQCNILGGNWLPEFNECEYISEDSCSDMNGTFMECESACRHDPEAEMCTEQCVPVCIIQ